MRYRDFITNLYESDGKGSQSVYRVVHRSDFMHGAHGPYVAHGRDHNNLEDAKKEHDEHPDTALSVAHIHYSYSGKESRAGTHKKINGKWHKTEGRGGRVLAKSVPHD
jgi:hypothetical protein